MYFVKRDILKHIPNNCIRKYIFLLIDNCDFLKLQFEFNLLSVITSPNLHRGNVFLLKNHTCTGLINKLKVNILFFKDRSGNKPSACVVCGALA